jgi:translation initiation factor IF-2
MIARPPVVVVVGHIDHGKTALLDYIRKTRIAEREAGGITQAIGAYQAEYGGKKITFIDTPGHEAFSAMRSRGAHVADVAVLVVAADEGVKAQTEEAIRIIQENELPYVVAINKTDKPNADPNRVKQELAERSVLVEGYGGTVPAAAISAKTGEGVNQLLETILLLAELEELSADPTKNGQGVVIESHLDPKRGAAATLLLEDGEVRRGDFVLIGEQVAPIRIFENFLGQPLDRAGPSEPIRIVSLPKVPALGERFMAFPSRAEAEAALDGVASAAGRQTPAAAGAPAAKTTVNVVLKADLLGSNEALEAAIVGMGSPELGAKVLKSEVGDITESDVKLAAASPPAVVAGFNVKVPPPSRELAERSGVAIVAGNVIYDLLEAIRAKLVELAPSELRRVDLGQAKVLALFKEERTKQIVGGRVEAGKVTSGARFEIIRNQLKIGSGRVLELQSGRKAVEEVPAGQEFGILAERDIAIAAGDTLAFFAEERIAPTL